MAKKDTTPRPEEENSNEKKGFIKNLTGFWGKKKGKQAQEPEAVENVSDEIEAEEKKDASVISSEDEKKDAKKEEEDAAKESKEEEDEFVDLEPKKEAEDTKETEEEDDEKEEEDQKEEERTAEKKKSSKKKNITKKEKDSDDQDEKESEEGKEEEDKKTENNKEKKKSDDEKKDKEDEEENKDEEEEKEEKKSSKKKKTSRKVSKKAGVALLASKYAKLKKEAEEGKDEEEEENEEDEKEEEKSSKKKKKSDGEKKDKEDDEKEEEEKEEKKSSKKKKTTKKESVADVKAVKKSKSKKNLPAGKAGEKEDEASTLFAEEVDIDLSSDDHDQSSDDELDALDTALEGADDEEFSINLDEVEIPESLLADVEELETIAETISAEELAEAAKFLGVFKGGVSMEKFKEYAAAEEAKAFDKEQVELAKKLEAQNAKGGGSANLLSLRQVVTFLSQQAELLKNMADISKLPIFNARKQKKLMDMLDKAENAPEQPAATVPPPVPPVPTAEAGPEAQQYQYPPGWDAESYAAYYQQYYQQQADQQAAAAAYPQQQTQEGWDPTQVTDAQIAQVQEQQAAAGYAQQAPQADAYDPNMDPTALDGDAGISAMDMQERAAMQQEQEQTELTAAELQERLDYEQQQQAAYAAQADGVTLDDTQLSAKERKRLEKQEEKARKAMEKEEKKRQKLEEKEAQKRQKEFEQQQQELAAQQAAEAAAQQAAFEASAGATEQAAQAYVQSETGQAQTEEELRQQMAQEGFLENAVQQEVPQAQVTNGEQTATNLALEMEEEGMFENLGPKPEEDNVEYVEEKLTREQLNELKREHKKLSRQEQKRLDEQTKKEKAQEKAWEEEAKRREQLLAKKAERMEKEKKRIEKRGGAPMKYKLPKAKKKRGGLAKFVNSLNYMGMEKDRVGFIDNLGTMMDAGLPLIEGIEALKKETKNKQMKKILGKMLVAIEMGSSLWRAMEAQDFFHDQQVAMVRVGEEAGNLVENLKYLSVQQEKDASLKAKVKTAMIYPIIVFSMLTVIVIGLGMFVLPNLIQVIYSLGVPLPFVTRCIVAFSNFFVNHGAIAIPSFFAGLMVFGLLNKYTALKSVTQWFMYKIPGIGGLIQEATISRFGVVMGGLLQAGVPVTDALESIANVTSLTRYKKFYYQMLEAVKLGDSFTTSFRKIKATQRCFPISVQQLIVTGEKSGSLTKIMLKIAEIHDKRASDIAEKLPVILEPMLLLFIGALVGTIALGILAPIYSVVGNVGG